MDWSAYTRVADLMAKNNLAYEALAQQFQTQVQGWRPRLGVTLCDAATGNFFLVPIHLEADHG